MGISTSSDSWFLNLFRNTEKEKDPVIAEYINEITEEALNVSTLWENVARAILSHGMAEAEGDLNWKRLVERPEWTIYSKNIPKSRLEIFHDKITSVLGKPQKGELSFVICRIASILEKRKLTRQLVEEELKKIRAARFFDKNNQIDNELTVEESIRLLHSEVAALRSYANQYQVKI